MNYIAKRVRAIDGEYLACRMYKFTGQDSDPTMVLVHGLGGDQVAWEFLIEELLKANLKVKAVVTYDLRGHSSSSRKISTLNYLSVATTDLAAVVKYFIPKNEKYLLVGHSLGAMIIQSFLNSQPKFLPIGVIMLGFSGRFRGIEAPSWFTSWVFRHGSRQLCRIRTRAQHEKFRGTPDIHLGRLQTDIQTVGMSHFVGLYTSLGKMNVADSGLTKVTMAVIVGDKDIFFPARGVKKFANKIHAQMFTIVKNGNHCLPVNCAPELARVFLEFISN